MNVYRFQNEERCTCNYFPFLKLKGQLYCTQHGMASSHCCLPHFLWNEFLYLCVLVVIDIWTSHQTSKTSSGTLHAWGNPAKFSPGSATQHGTYLHSYISTISLAFQLITCLQKVLNYCANMGLESHKCDQMTIVYREVLMWDMKMFWKPMVTAAASTNTVKITELNTGKSTV